MREKTQKSWAVYWNRSHQYRIGKLEYCYPADSCFWIRSQEHEDIEAWQKEFVRAFDNPLKAIAYSLVITDFKNNRSHKSYYHQDAKRQQIEDFFARFPSEKTNFEKLLAQSQPK